MHQNPQAEKTFQSLAKEFQDAVQENARFQNANLAKLLKDKLVILIDQISGYIQMNQWFLPLKTYQQNNQLDFLEDNANYAEIKNLRDKLDEKLKECKGLINKVSHDLISRFYHLDKKPSITEEEVEKEKEMKTELENIIKDIQKKIKPQNQNSKPENIKDLFLQSMNADLQNYSSFLNKLKDVYISFWIDFKTMIFSFAQLREEAPLKQDKIKQIAVEFQAIYDRDVVTKQIQFIKEIAITIKNKQPTKLQNQSQTIFQITSEILTQTIEWHKQFLENSELDKKIQDFEKCSDASRYNLMKEIIELSIRILEAQNQPHVQEIFQNLKTIQDSIYS